MQRIGELVTNILHDEKVGGEELAVISEAIIQDGKLDLDDVKLLTELYVNARQRDETFDNLFFDTLGHVMLEDKAIAPSEQYYLLKMIYSDHEILPREREFLKQVRSAIAEPNPDFEQLFETAMTAEPRNWCVGGK